MSRVGHRAVWLIALLALGCGRKAAPAEESPPQAESASPQPSKPAESPSVAPAPLAAAPPVPPICADLCKRAPSLQCGSVESCADGCRQMLALPGCQAEMLAFLTCASAEPDGHWECDPASTTPSLKDGYCETQQGALVGCMEKAS